jgi:DNA-binding transcriptional MerR regulator
MPSIDSYLALAPFTKEELVDAANSVLRDRPRLHVSGRTVRYYVSEHVLPPPGGSPKLARYGAEHFIRLVAARCLIDRGLSLEDVRPRLDGLLSEGIPAAADQAQRLAVEHDYTPAAELRVPDAVYQVRESPAPTPMISTTVRRITLCDRIVLEYPDGMAQEEALEMARGALYQTITSSSLLGEAG